MRYFVPILYNEKEPTVFGWLLVCVMLSLGRAPYNTKPSEKLACFSHIIHIHIMQLLGWIVDVMLRRFVLVAFCSRFAR
jgi:hypothetical protein